MEKQINDRLLSLGVHYFVIARFTVFAGFMPTCGNLYHLAFEMLLKSILCKKYPVSELRGHYGHNLKKMWKDFKTLINNPEAEKFDSVIDNLDKYEMIRYLESRNNKGLGMTVDFDTSLKVKKLNKPDKQTDHYSFNFDDMDRLFKFIINKGSVNPAFLRHYLFKTEAIQAYERENKSSIFK